MGQGFPAPAGRPDPRDGEAPRVAARDRAGLGVAGFRATRSIVAAIDRPQGALLVGFHGVLYDRLTPRDEDLAARIADLYAREGVGFVRALRGDFVLAIWDAGAQALHLATDPFRVESLVYTTHGDRIAFASHMGALLACPAPFPRTIDPSAILDVFTSSCIHTPQTIFRDVQKLPPGTVLTWRDGRADLETYWDMDYRTLDSSGEASLATRLRELFSRAVESRVAAEPEGATVGSFLSGGVDSTAVTSVLAKRSPRPVQAFSIGFAERYFNEMDYARIAARAAGVQHHEYYVTPEDAFQAVPIVLQSFDEPFANASAIPTYFCARFAREHGVDVLYAGDAGDELFAGNERYASRRVFDHYDRVPRFLRDRVVTPGVDLLAKAVPGPFFRRARNYILQASLPYPERLTSFSVFNYIPLRTIFTDDLLASAGSSWAPGGAVAHHYRASRALDVLDRELYIDLKLAISDNDLFKVTRMSHAAGVAVRFPFLDRDLAEFSATIPARLKMRGGRLRAFFKDAYRDVLPPEVQSKRKHGFGLPIAMWLETHPPFREMIEDLLLSPRALERGYFRREGIEALLRGHRNDPKGFYGTFLWNMMTLEMWHRRFLD